MKRSKGFEGKQQTHTDIFIPHNSKLKIKINSSLLRFLNDDKQIKNLHTYTTLYFLIKRPGNNSLKWR